MTPAFRRLGTSELLPRYIFIEHLFVRRRVLEVGAVAATKGESAKFLLTRGARSVLACDQALDAVSEAQRTLASNGLRFRSNVFDDLESGSFDLVLVADLAPYVHAPLLLKELVRLVTPYGHLVGGLRNPAGLALSQISDPEDKDALPTYGQLLDALTPHYPVVEVATQSPLLGYQLALESGEGLQVDGSLSGTPEASYFVVLAGQEKVRQVEPTWVQLPPAPLAYASGRLEEFAHRAKGWEERHERVKEAWEKARTEADTRQTALLQLRQELERAREESARTLAQLELRERSASAAREGDELTHKVRRLEAELQVARERAEDAERRVMGARADVEGAVQAQQQLAAQALASQEAARLERAKRDELLSQVEDARERAAQAYEAARREQDAASAARMELERSAIREAQAEDGLRVKTQELVAAREREVVLAEAHSVALAGLEALRREVHESRNKVEQATRTQTARDADLELAQRAAQTEAQARAELELRLRDEVREASQIREDLETQLRQLSTELAGALDERQSLEARVAAGSDAHALAASLESRWVEARDAAGQWESRANELGAQLEVERARIHRLERDGEGQLVQERAAREAAEAELDRLRRSAQEVQANLSSLFTEQESERQERARELEWLRTQLSAAESALNRAQASAEDARSGREASERSLLQIRAEATQTRGQLEAVNEQLSRAEVALQTHEEELERAEQRWNEAQETWRQALDAARASEGQVAQARAREEVLEKALEEADAGRKAMTAEVEGLRALSAEVEEREAERRKLLDERQAQESQIQTLESSFARGQEELEQLRARAGADAAQLAQLQGERLALQESQERLTSDLDQLRARAEELEEAAQESAPRFAAEVEKREAELRRTLDTLKLLEGNQARERADWEQKRTELASRIEDLSERLHLSETGEEERTQLTSQLQQVQQARSDLQSQMEELTAKVGLGQRADEERLRLISQLQGQEMEHGKLRRELEQAQTELERTQAALKGEAQAETTALKAELERARAALRSSATDRERQQAQGQAATQELQRLKTELQQKTDAEAELSAKLAEKDNRWDVVQRRLNAQETELTALRRVAGRPQPAAPQNVEQIYQRANAELSAVKAELLNKKPGAAAPPSGPPSAPAARPAAKPGTPPPAPPSGTGNKKP